MTTETMLTLRRAAIAAARETRRQDEEYRRTQEANRLAEQIKDARDTFAALFKVPLPDDTQIVQFDETRRVRFAYQDLEFFYRGYVRGNGGLDVVLSCHGLENEEGRWVHPPAEVGIGITSLQDLGELLTEDVATREARVRRACSECYRLSEDGGNFDVQTPLLARLTPVERLAEAIGAIVNDAIDARDEVGR